MTRIKIQGKATLSWGHELVEDKDSGNFYMRVFPVLKGFKPTKTHFEQAAKDVLADIAAGHKNIKVNK